jgi:formylmethanofuran--tetrahydromethanopterin N-formyltransferase
MHESIPRSEFRIPHSLTSLVVDTFAEAFPMTAARAIVTADTLSWAEIAGRTMSGYATSVIACDAEAAIERVYSPDETPDGRTGVSVLVFAFSRESLEKALVNRVGQCVMTCPTSACYNGLPVGEKTINVGGRLRYFGDGWQISKQLSGRRFWRVPVMDGEFLCEETYGTVKGVAGGNVIILGSDPAGILAAAEAAVTAMRQSPDVILPFPGGIARSGSKVGSKYKALRASTNTAFAPTLRGLVPTDLPQDASCGYEIVIDGLSLEAVERATAAGLRAGARSGTGVVAITAGNYGGKLGPYHIRLHEVLLRFGANDHAEAGAAE